MRFIQSFLDIIVPDTCILCGQSQAVRNDHLLCHFCWAALPRNPSCCSKCARPLANPGVCGNCQTAPPTNGLCVIPLLHEAEGRLLVHQLKFSNGFRAGRTLASAMVQSIGQVYADQSLPECMVPMPLSYRRQVMRGYNQAAWLVHNIRRTLKLPFFYGPLKRRHGPMQQTLSKRARLALPRNTFAMQQPLPFRHVAIVDDVLTTGTSTRVLSELLHKQGAERVDIWCATRAILH